MGLATHLGPWALGTVKNTTGTALGTLRNMGPTLVSQYKIVGVNDPANSVAFVIPAGAQILYFQVCFYEYYDTITSTIQLTATGGSLPSTTNLNTGASTYLYVEQKPVILIKNASIMGYTVNTGTTDSIVRYTVTKNSSTYGSSYLSVNYIMLNQDGTYMPSAFKVPKQTCLNPIKKAHGL